MKQSKALVLYFEAIEKLIEQGVDEDKAVEIVIGAVRKAIDKLEKENSDE